MTNEKKRILIVDDDESLCRSMELIFKAKGYITKCIHRGKPAIELIDNEEFDLVMLDVRLPDMDGVDVLKTILEINPNLDIIMMTGYASVESVVHSLNIGATAYIIKPVNMEEVLRTVSSAIEKRSFEMKSKKTQEMLEEREERFRFVVETMKDGLTILENDQVVFLNDRICEITGYSRDELFNLTGIDLALPEEKDRLSQFRESRRSEKGPKEIKFWIRKKDGSKILLRNVYSSRINAEGTKIGYIYSQDITKEHKDKKPLEESEKRFRDFFQKAPSYCYMISTDGIIVNVNESALKALGYSRDELIGCPVTKIYPPSSHAKVEELFKIWKKQGIIDGEVLPILTKNGDERIVDLYVSSVRNEDGDILYSVSIQEDITDRIEAEEKLRKEQLKQASILQASQIGIGLAKDRKFTFVSESLSELVGYSVEELIGMEIRNLYPTDEEYVRAGEILYSDLDETGSSTIKTCFVKQDGSKVDIIVKLASIDELDTNEVAFSIMDITEFQRIKTELESKTEAYKILIDCINDLIFVFNEHNEYLHFYGSNRDSLFVSPKEFVGRHVSEVLPEEVSKKFISLADEVRSTGKPSEFEYKLNISGEEHWFSALITLHKDGKKIVAVIRNITEKKEYVHQLEKEQVLLKKSEESLEKLTQSYELLISNLPGAVYRWKYDTEWQLDFLSGKIEEITGYDSEHYLNAESVSSLIHPDEKTILEQAITESVQEREPFEVQHRIVHSESIEKWVINRGFPVFDEGEFKYIEGMLFDVTLLKEQERIMTHELKTKELLLRELHHRIKNNLQIISGLFYLQTLRTKDESAKRILMEGQSRVRTMSLIHEVLYRSQAVDKINMGFYIKELISTLYDAYDVDASKIKTEVHVDPIQLDIDSSVPCGLIINELVSNALKYAFEGKDEGMIVIILKNAEGNNVELIIEDNGVGLPSDFDIEKTDTLGMRVVRELAEGQLNGTIHIPETKIGLRFVISFKVGDSQK